MQPRLSTSTWLQATLAGILAVALLGGCAKQEATSAPAAEAPAAESAASTESATSSEETPTAPTTEGESEAPKQ